MLVNCLLVSGRMLFFVEVQVHHLAVLSTWIACWSGSSCSLMKREAFQSCSRRTLLHMHARTCMCGALFDLRAAHPGGPRRLTGRPPDPFPPPPPQAPKSFRIRLGSWI